MNIRDIRNQDPSGLSTCESEPIHVPGSIQPHGVLLATDDAGLIRFVSGNSTELFGAGPAQLLGLSLGLFDAALFARLREALDRNRPDRPFRFETAAGAWEVFVQRNDDGLMLAEFEKAVGPGDGLPDSYDQTATFVELIGRSRSLQELCQHIAVQTRAITGYDRVMIYRFDPDYNGQVFAEARAPELEPFLHLHYPHTDIPVQARELYLRNKLRMIVDVDYEPVPLFAHSTETLQQPDLSESVLRSVSPIHIQYLKNMGVAATLTVSLLLEGRLWGLIACHHRQPLHLSPEQRRAALLQGYFLSSQIRVREVAEEYEVHNVVEAHLQQLLQVLGQEGDFGIRFRNFSSLLGVANASGAVLLHKGQLYEKGLVPQRERVRTLLNWLADHCAGLQFTTAHLQAHYPEAVRIGREASGILYYRLGDPKQDAIIWFREEYEHTIDWAGNPHDSVKRAPLTNELTPRSSFALYRELVRGRSRDWRPAEVHAAGRFAGALQNQVHIEYLKAEEASQRLLNEKLSRANSELENINWITSHDLKEPIRKILLFSSRVRDAEECQLSEAVLNALEKIQGAARRMHDLVDDIMSYSLADARSGGTEPTDLNAVLDEVLQELQEEIRECRVQIGSDPLPVLPAIRFQMRQLFVNLIGNAIKFSNGAAAPEIHIRCRKGTGAQFGPPLLAEDLVYYQISVEDNGIGFETGQSQRIFDVFFRLHHKEDYEGTGIGLAVCRRIVENHGGHIRAEGRPGQGARFDFFLPANPAGRLS